MSSNDPGDEPRVTIPVAPRQRPGRPASSAQYTKDQVARRRPGTSGKSTNGNSTNGNSTNGNSTNGNGNPATANGQPASGNGSAVAHVGGAPGDPLLTPPHTARLPSSMPAHPPYVVPISDPLEADRTIDRTQTRGLRAGAEPLDPSLDPDLPQRAPREKVAHVVPLRRRRRPRVRRVTRVIRHIDPWSVFKVALCFSVVLYGVCLTAGVLLWNVAYTTGTVDNMQRFFESFGWDTFEFKGGELYHNAWIAGIFVAIGLTGFIVLAVTLFNLLTDLVGGVRVTVLEEEVVELEPAVRSPLLRSRSRHTSSTVSGTARSQWGVADDGEIRDAREVVRAVREPRETRESREVALARQENRSPRIVGGQDVADSPQPSGQLG